MGTFGVDTRILDAMRKMSPGTMGGQSVVATPPGFKRPSGLGNITVSASVTDYCTTFIGRTVATLSYGALMMLPSMTSLYQHSPGSDEVYVFSYPNLATSVTTFNILSGAAGMTMDHNGTIWWITNTGEVYRRDDASSSGTDVLVTTLPGPYFITARMAYSNHNQNIYAIYNASMGATDDYRVYRITPAGVVTHMLTVNSPTASRKIPETIVAVGGSIWCGHLEAGVTSFYRYDIDSNTLSTFDNPASFMGAHVAADHLGQVVVQSGVDGLGVLDESGVFIALDCPELGAEPSGLQCGAVVIGNPTVAIMSYYLGYTGEPDADWIWEWT